MTLGDITEVMAIENTTTSPWSEKQMRAELTGKNGWYFVYRQHHKGATIGFITGTLVCNEADIRKLAVASQHRRSGVASFLLAHLFSYLNKQRVAKCFLELRSSNLAAKRLYRDFNFHDTGIRKGYYRETNEDAILMSKIIKGEFS